MNSTESGTTHCHQRDETCSVYFSAAANDVSAVILLLLRNTDAFAATLGEMADFLAEKRPCHPQNRGLDTTAVMGVPFSVQWCRLVPPFPFPVRSNDVCSVLSTPQRLSCDLPRSSSGISICRSSQQARTGSGVLPTGNASLARIATEHRGPQD